MLFANAIRDWNIGHYFMHPWFWSAFLGWIIAQTIKMVIAAFKRKTFDFEYLVSTGGMPSAHTAMVVALTTSVGLTEDAAVVFERHGWSHVSEWIREMPILKEKGERYCVFELTAESAANDMGLPMMMLVMMASEMDELNGGVTCNTVRSKDGQNHFTLLYKKAV